MTLKGTVTRIANAGTYSFIRLPSQEEDYFAHEEHFEKPELMRVGQSVVFTPITTPRGKAAVEIRAA